MSNGRAEAPLSPPSLTPVARGDCTRAPTPPLSGHLHEHRAACSPHSDGALLTRPGHRFPATRESSETVPGSRVPRSLRTERTLPAPPRHPPGRLAHGASEAGRPGAPGTPGRVHTSPWQQHSRSGPGRGGQSGNLCSRHGHGKPSLPTWDARSVGGLGKERLTMRPRFRERCSWERPTENQGGRGGRGAPGRGSSRAGPSPSEEAPPPPETLVFKKERQRRREREGLGLGRAGKGSQRRKTQRWSVGPNPQHSWRSDHG